jgi:hypothetical protein
MKLRHPSLFTLTLFSGIVLLFFGQAEATLVLYQNDFETVNSPPGFIDTTGKDVSQQTINALYSTPGFLFQQTNTVETLEINGGVAFGSGYSDPQGIGGNYTLGMLSSVQDDHVALVFNVGTFNFLNVGMDISAIDLDGVGGPFGVDQPIFRLSLYDAPGGIFNISSPGTLLDQIDVMGTGTPHQSIFDWTGIIAPLSAAASTDGNVALDIELIQSGYAAFDNIIIASSDQSGEIDECQASYEAGRQACIDNPASCGIVVDGTSTVTIAPDLNISIFRGIYNTLLSPLPLWAELEYVPTEDEDYWWKLSDFGLISE